MKHGWLARRGSARRFTLPLLIAFTLIAGCSKEPQATSGPEPIASPDQPQVAPRTQRDFERDHYARLVRHTVQTAQKAAASQQATVDPNIIDFLNHACLYQMRQEKAPVREALEEEVRRLLDASYDHPIFLRAAGQVLADGRKTSESVALEQQALKSFENKPGAQVNRFLAAEQLAAALRDLEGSNSAEAARWQLTALDALVAAIVANAFTHAEAPIAYRYLTETTARTGDDTAWARTLDALGGAEGLGPWLPRMVAGHAALEAAFKTRGSEPAGKISEQTWIAFFERLAEARKAFSAAWRARPGHPESATAMLRVAINEKRLPPGETDRTWFERAVAAQVDYLPAYETMAEKLTPAPGASSETLERFGRDCLATGRFDTAAPLYYWAVLRQLGEAKPGDSWRAVFRRQGVRERLLDLYQKMLQQPAWAGERGKILALKIVTEAWSGNYDESKRLLDQFGAQADLDGELLGRPLLWRGVTRPVFLAELEAFTGPQKNGLRKAEDLLLIKPSPVALEQMTQAMDASRATPRTFIYLRDRIAVSRLELPPGEYLDYRHGMTALYLAAKHNALDVMRFLLERGADPAARYDRTATALDAARAQGHAQAADLLLQHRPVAVLAAPAAAPASPVTEQAAPVANATATSATTATASNTATTTAMAPPAELGAPRDGAALMQAIQQGDATAASTLIAGGADIKARDEAGMSPLHIATNQRQTATIRELLKNGAAVNAKTNGGHTPLHLACENGAIESVRLLLDGGANVNEAAPDGWTPLSLAVQRNYPSIVALLLDHGAKVNAPGLGGAKPLDIAVAAGSAPIVKQLLDLGADTNSSAGGNPKPLEQAILKNQPEIAVMLIDLGANVNAADPNGQMPLHNAVARREGPIVAKLLGTGAQPNAVNKENRMPLQVAIEKGFADMVETLLSKGASVRTPASDGRSMLELAQAGGNQRIIELVTAKAAKRSTKPAAPAAPKTPAAPPAAKSAPTTPAAPPAANPAPAPTATPAPPTGTTPDAPSGDAPEVPSVPGA